MSTKNPLINYDALQDKHASFYFNGYGVKKHLKKLKKVTEILFRHSKSNPFKSDTNSTHKCWIINLQSYSIRKRNCIRKPSLMFRLWSNLPYKNYRRYMPLTTIVELRIICLKMTKYIKKRPIFHSKTCQISLNTK